jgi:hypothetical protein
MQTFRRNKFSGSVMWSYTMTLVRWGFSAAMLVLAATAAHGQTLRHGTTTFFDGTQGPFFACGVPPAKMKDDNGKALPFVALNTVKGSRTLSGSYPTPSGNVGAYNSGLDCGRWIQITLRENCVAGSNSQWSVCNGGSAALLHLHTSPPPPCVLALRNSLQFIVLPHACVFRCHKQ